jgi:flagellar hook-associated protein 2
MGRISSNVGILSGIPIEETVKQLISISARPRDLLQSRNDTLGKQQAAFTEITALAVGVQFAALNLGKDSTFDKQTVSVSDAGKLSAAITGSATSGVYALTPDRTAQTHHLLGTGLASRTTALGVGEIEFSIDGGDPVEIAIDADDTLDDLVEKINDADAGVTASVLSDGSGTPYRLSLISQTSGEAGEITVATAPPGITFTEVAEARDARLYIGTPATGVAVTSSTNTFEDVLPGVTVTVVAGATDPITVTVADSDATFLTQAKLFVEQYNKLVDKLDSYTTFDAATGAKGLLFGSGEVVRIESELARVVTGRYFGLGDVQSLAELGFSLSGETGKLSLDETRLKAEYAADPAAVRDFFATEDTGISARLDAVLEGIAGEDDSLLISRINSLQAKMEFNSERIDFMTERLAREQERLTNQFYALDALVGNLKSQISILDNIQPFQFASSS